MGFTRDTTSFGADHTSLSMPLLEMDSLGFGMQSQATSAQRADTFLGPADLAGADVGIFGDLSAAAAQPSTVLTRSDRSPGSPESRVAAKESLVLSSIEAPARRLAEREGGISAANPMRFGAKAMKIGLDIDPGYLEEMRADMASPTGGTRVQPLHLNAWLSVPDVILLVNPASLDWSLTNTVQDTRTRGGFMQEFWPSELDTLSASGTTAVAYVASFGRPDQGGGLTIRDLRSNSAGYRNLRRLVDIYRSNGIIYGLRAMGNYAIGNAPEKPAFRKTLLYGGFVTILYDGITYRGFFENFEIREAGDAPFWLEWNFTFKVESHAGEDLKMYDSGKFLGKSSSRDAEFSSLSANITGQRNT